MADRIEDKDVPREDGSPDAQDGIAQKAIGGDGGAAQDDNGVPVPAEDASAMVEHMKAELDTLQDRLLRQAAEFQNYRRRTEQERAGLIELGKGMVLTPLLGVLDDFGRSVEAAEQVEQQNLEAAYASLKEGVVLVHRRFVDELARLGVQPIEAVGQPFSEAEHEAMMQQPAPEGTIPGTVLTEFQKGYRLGDRVLRHSKVVVAS